jgi:hypothetical protein
VRIKGERHDGTTIGYLFGAIEQSLMTFMYAIEDSDDYYGRLAHGFNPALPSSLPQKLQQVLPYQVNF